MAVHGMARRACVEIETTVLACGPWSGFTHCLPSSFPEVVVLCVLCACKGNYGLAWGPWSGFTHCFPSSFPEVVVFALCLPMQGGFE